MPPTNIFLVRHGERVDSVDPHYAMTSDRPHDCPLTENGMDTSRVLGHYLSTTYSLDPTTTVIFSSPLVRCVQTAHSLVTGIQSATPTEAFVPIYVDNSLAEGGQWVQHDLLKNPNIADGSHLTCPQPLWKTSTSHFMNHSTNVRLLNLFDINADPKIIIETNCLKEPNFVARCSHGAKSLLANPDVDGKNVIVVTHGDTATRWMYSISQVTMIPQANPPFTGFMHLCSDDSGTWRPQMDTFCTPHLVSGTTPLGCDAELQGTQVSWQ